MIKKRSSLNIMELPTRPASGSTNPDAPSPLKFIRKLTRQASTVNGSSTKIQTCISSVPNKTQEVIQQCIAMVEQLRQQHQERQASRFFHIRSCSMPCDRVSIINSLIDTILPQSPRKPQRSLEGEIQSVMQQLIEEKQCKQRAIDQRDSLAKRQDYSIQQLVRFYRYALRNLELSNIKRQIEYIKNHESQKCFLLFSCIINQI